MTLTKSVLEQTDIDAADLSEIEFIVDSDLRDRINRMSIGKVFFHVFSKFDIFFNFRRTNSLFRKCKEIFERQKRNGSIYSRNHNRCCFCYVGICVVLFIIKYILLNSIYPSKVMCSKCRQTPNCVIRAQEEGGINPPPPLPQRTNNAGR